MSKVLTNILKELSREDNIKIAKIAKIKRMEKERLERLKKFNNK